MPPQIRAILSIVLLVSAYILWHFREAISMNTTPVFFFGLTLCLVGALWMFPEVKKKEGSR